MGTPPMFVYNRACLEGAWARDIDETIHLSGQRWKLNVKVKSVFWGSGEDLVSGSSSVRLLKTNIALQPVEIKDERV